MADSFPPTDPSSMCEEDEEDEEDMEEEEEEELEAAEAMEEDFTVHIGHTYACRNPDGIYVGAKVIKIRINHSTQREEYLVRYSSLNQRQTVWVDKSWLTPLDPEEDKVVDEGSEKVISGAKKTPQDKKPDEDEPETKKPRVDSYESAGKISLVVRGKIAEELTCLLCSKLYEDPVMVECGHNFCRRCIDEAWADQESFTCPDCKEELKEKSYCPNRTLEKLAKKAASIEAPTIHFKNCEDHEEQVMFFCKNDGTLNCAICLDSLKHTKHTFLPIPEALSLYRSQLSGVINPLEEALTKADKKVVKYREKIKQQENKISEYRQHIVSEYEKLYSFLMERKESLLERLRTQGQEVSEAMEPHAAMLVQNRDSLRQLFAEASEKVEDTDPYSFFHNLDPLLEQLKQKKEDIPAVTSVCAKELCHGMFNGPLQYMVWRQMKSIIGPIKDQPSKPKARTTDQKKVDPVPESPEQSNSTKKGSKEVWLFGDDYLLEARSLLELGLHTDILSFAQSPCDLHWFTKIHAWSSLLPKMRSISKRHGNPDIVVIHVGHVELGHTSLGSFNVSVQKVLDRIRRRFPKARMVLSTILPRKEWLGSRVENVRQRFNATLRKYAAKHNFHAVRLHLLEDAIFQRIKRGGDSQLLETENVMFLRGLREAVLKALQKLIFREGLVKELQVDALTKRGRALDLSVYYNKELLKSHQSIKEEKSSKDAKIAPVSKVGETSQAPKATAAKITPVPKVDETSQPPKATSAKISPVSKVGETSQPPKAEDAKITPVPKVGEKPQPPKATETMIAPVSKVLTPQPPKAPVLKPQPPKVPVFKDPQIIWIVGNIYIYKAYGFVGKRPYGPHLGLKAHNCSLRWLGRTMRWSGLLPELELSVASQGTPLALVLHIGSHDLELISYEDLIQDMRTNLAKLKEMFPTVEVILSPVLPKAEWVGSHIGEWRKMFNTRLERYAALHGLHMVRYDALEKMLEARFRKDGDSALYVDENEMFVTGIRDALVTAMIKVGQQGDNVLEQKELSLWSSEGFAQKQVQPSPGTPEGEASVEEFAPKYGISPEQKLILIAGNNAISSSSSFAALRPYGRNLGFEEKEWCVRWLGSLTQHKSLITTLKNFLRVKLQITAIFLHLGKQHVVRAGEVHSAMLSLIKLFPNTLIILSSVLPRAEWMLNEMEPARIYANERLKSFAAEKGVEFVEFKEVEEMQIARFKGGDPCSILTDKEQEAFINLIKDSLHKALKVEEQPVTSQRDDDVTEDSDLSLELDESHQEQYEEPPIDPENLPEHNIWIVGDAFIHEAHTHAVSSSLGQNLGLEQRNWTLHWLGKTMLWSELKFKMWNSMTSLGMPSVVFLHLGDNDLAQGRMVKLLGEVRAHLTQLVTTFPNTKFIISPILPKAEWMESPTNGFRKKFNTVTADFAQRRRCDVVHHDRVERMRLARFREGNNNDSLEPREMDEFIKTLRISLLKAVYKDPNDAPEPSPSPPSPEASSSVFVSSEDTPGPKSVWIIGSSFLWKAKEFADSRPQWHNLGLNEEDITVHWLGSIDMRWEAFKEAVEKAKQELGTPSGVLLHLGGNDMGNIPFQEFFKTVKQDLRHFDKNFRKTRLVCSNILPRAEWLETPVEQVRLQFNRNMSQISPYFHFHVLRHRKVERNAIARFSNGGSNDLSHEEYELLLTSIKESVQKMLEV